MADRGTELLIPRTPHTRSPSASAGSPCEPDADGGADRCTECTAVPPRCRECGARSGAMGIGDQWRYGSVGTSRFSSSNQLRTTWSRVHGSRSALIITKSPSRLTSKTCDLGYQSVRIGLGSRTVGGSSVPVRGSPVSPCEPIRRATCRCRCGRSGAARSLPRCRSPKERSRSRPGRARARRRWRPMRATDPRD